MRPGSIFYVLGKLLQLTAFFMLFPVLIGLHYQEEDAFVFIISMGITAVSGFLLKLFKNRGLHYKDGFVIVTLGWLLVSLYGAFPFLFTRCFFKPCRCIF